MLNALNALKEALVFLKPLNSHWAAEGWDGTGCIGFNQKHLHRPCVQLTASLF